MGIQAIRFLWQSEINVELYPGLMVANSLRPIDEGARTSLFASLRRFPSWLLPHALFFTQGACRQTSIAVMTQRCAEDSEAPWC